MRLISHFETLVEYRDLIMRLAWSDFKLRYKSSVLGFFWSLLEPLLMLLVTYAIFSYLMKVQVEHYQLFLLLGIILWNFLDRGTTMSISGIIGKPSLVLKVYFPRDILIIATCITALMMSLLEFVVFAIFMGIFRVVPDGNILYLPLIFFFEFILILGLSLALSSLVVYFRDVQFIWRLIMQLGFFATPILYPITIFPDHLQSLVMLNPMARIITTLRGCTLYHSPPSAGDLIYVALATLLILSIGYFIFNRLEPRFAEEI